MQKHSGLSITRIPKIRIISIMLPTPNRPPRATYRLQFTPEFGFKEAQELVPYLAQLGISELYASPFFQASSSSTHGYDVNDYNRISATLGGIEGLNRLSEILRKEDLGLLVDFVPNHMGIDGEFNVWWRDVLENGTHSRFASYFDIEWHSRIERLKDRVLVPVLDDHYGAVLEDGRLRLAYEKGRFFICFGSLRLPLRPKSYGLVFDQIVELLPSGDGQKSRLRERAEAFEHLPTHEPEERDAMLRKLREDWAETFDADIPLQSVVRAAIDKINGIPGDALSFLKLHEILEQQHYRLAYWKVGAHEVNYRRFFAVDTLVGLKMEQPEVFAVTHGLLGDLLAAGVISGIRLDHIDGLWDPAQYLRRLKDLVQDRRPEGGTVYTLVEKILASEEALPEAWAIHGTTGYEFTASLIDLFLDCGDEPAWTRIYGNFTDERKASRDLTYTDKLFALQEIFPNAVANLAVELDALIEVDWHWRDLSLHDLETALRHLLACLPVYRTYRMPGELMADSERKWLSQALEEAILRNPCVDPVPIRFLFQVIVGDYPAADASSEQQAALSAWVCKLQQATGAVMAKSVEDTHFYRYVRMLGANEVGSHPSRFGKPVNLFHEANVLRYERTPLGQVTTSTHDTKMSEDARARLFALAELPDEWETHLRAWHRLSEPARQQIADRPAPDAREEYLLYQALLATWPLGQTKPDEMFRDRIKAYFRKAQAEAKLNTTWTCPHAGHVAAGDNFVDALFGLPEFLADFLPFVQRIAYRGMVFSLAQTVLKLTVPGVPDIYQGNEMWDFSLVDPDNRRLVDFEIRRAMLAKLDQRSPGDLLANWQDGGIKMQLIRTLLLCRRTLPELFASGNYVPLQPQGSKANRVVSFMRQYQSKELMVIVPRRLGDAQAPYLEPVWKDTFVPVSGARIWSNVLTGRPLKASGDEVHLDSAFSDWPVAVLVSS